MDGGVLYYYFIGLKSQTIVDETLILRMMYSAIAHHTKCNIPCPLKCMGVTLFINVKFRRVFTLNHI